MLAECEHPLASYRESQRPASRADGIAAEPQSQSRARVTAVSEIAVAVHSSARASI
jgi:hypothetical protein